MTDPYDPKPHRPWFRTWENSGCTVCHEYIRDGELVVPAITPWNWSKRQRAHYLCAVESDDEMVSRDPRDYDERGQRVYASAPGNSDAAQEES